MADWGLRTGKCIAYAQASAMAMSKMHRLVGMADSDKDGCVDSSARAIADEPKEVRIVQSVTDTPLLILSFTKVV